MKRKDILNILFWIFLIISIILLVWYIFGNSPTELAITMTFLLTLLLKMWAISDNLNEFKHEVKLSFHQVKQDTDNMNQKINIHDNKINKSKNK